MSEEAGEEMYVVPPPQRSDLGSGSAAGSKDLRVYQAWKGSNVSADFSHCQLLVLSILLFL